MSKRAPIIHWFRRDLRIADNRSFFAAASVGREIVPVYILSDWTDRHAWTGVKRQHFLCGCLASLSRDLEAMGGRLILRQGEAVARLEALLRESGARELHFNADPDPFGPRTGKFGEKKNEESRKAGSKPISIHFLKFLFSSFQS